jgi:hypothetical protein
MFERLLAMVFSACESALSPLNAIEKLGIEILLE